MQSSDIFSGSRNRVSKVLFIFAWVIEIFAVLTGLAITLMVGIVTYEKNLEITGIGAGVTNYTNVVIASLPFLMVSIVELAKIPVAQALYVTKNIIWKAIFIFVLVFLALITFETALNGFERNFNNLNFQVSASREQLDAVNEQIDILNKQIVEAKTLTREDITADFERQNNIFVKNRESAMAVFSTAESLAQTKQDNTQVKALEAQLSDVKNERNRLLEQRESEIASASSNYAANEVQIRKEGEETRKTLIDEQKQAEDRLRELETAMQREMNKTIFDAGVRKRFEPRIERAERDLEAANRRLREFSVAKKITENSKQAPKILDTINSKYEKKIANVDARISELNIEIAKIAGVRQSDVERERKRINEERKRIEAVYSKNRDAIVSQRDQQLEILKNKEAKINANEAKISDLQIIVADLKNKINARANDNQIYRIAMMFDSGANTAADVSRSAVDAVGKIWFGSLALVIAITGIMLALASEVVNDSAQIKQGITRKRSGLRSLALAINRRQRKHPKIQVKEVVKEVPVDRVVLQDVVKEVPVEKVVMRDVVQEVVKKEVLHVPVYTNDPDLVKKQYDE